MYSENGLISDGASATGANAAKILKVSWITLPIGILVTLGACIFVFWWQDLSYSSPYGHAILINGKPTDLEFQGCGALVLHNIKTILILEVLHLIY